MKTALITGIAGQDASYLSKLLIEKGYNVYGFNKQRTPTDNLKKLGVTGVTVIDGDITDPSSVSMAIRVAQPDEIYNLAAQSHVGHSFKVPQLTCSVNYMGFLNILLEARRLTPHAKIYQAGTSEMFGYAAKALQDEETPLQPKSPYAISKVAAHWAGVNARHEAGQFVSNGILFNHESPLRHPDFVTRKITMAVNRINNGSNETLRLGNIDSKRDWGFAGDYVDAMYRMLQHDKPDDFVVATGKVHSVRDFVTEAFAVCGKEIRFAGSGLHEVGYIGSRLVLEIDEKFYRPNDLTFLRGDYSKIRSVLGWEPKMTFKTLVREMIYGD